MCSNNDTMDSRYRFSANMPNRYEQLSSSSNLNNNNNNNMNFNHINRSNPISNRYLNRNPLMFPQHHQQRLRTSPPMFSSSYLGPLQQHQYQNSPTHRSQRPRFLSAWDLTPNPTIYHSSRNLASTTSTPTPVSKPHDDGACILNSCLSSSSSFSTNWLHIR